MPSDNISFFLATAFGNPSSLPAQLRGRVDKVMWNTAVFSTVITGWDLKFSWGISSWRRSQHVAPGLHARRNGKVGRSKLQGLGVQPYHCKFIVRMKHAFPSMMIDTSLIIDTYFEKKIKNLTAKGQAC